MRSQEDTTTGCATDPINSESRVFGYSFAHGDQAEALHKSVKNKKKSSLEHLWECRDASRVPGIAVETLASN